MAKQYNKVDVFINEDKRETKESLARIQKRLEEERTEKARQELDGVVTKPAKIGRKTYKMKKTDFQMEDELAGSLREVRPIGKDDFFRDRMDSMFGNFNSVIQDKILISLNEMTGKNGLDYQERIKQLSLIHI